MAGLCVAQPAVADDFAALFNEDFKGISLVRPDPNATTGGRPLANDRAPEALPGYLLSSEELSLVLKVANPVEYGNAGEQAAPLDLSIRERFVRWLTQSTKTSADPNVFSALAREPEELGIRVDIDAASEEVLLGYRVGF